MWKKLQESPNYYLRFNESSSYDVFVTDYITIWFIYYSKNNFLSCLKECNEGLEFDNELDWLKKGVEMLLNPDKLKDLDISTNSANNLHISMTMYFGFPVYMKLKLVKGSRELFFQAITQPLLRSIQDLKSSQDELRRLLIKKDNEIEEYKNTVGAVAFRHLRTVAFNDEIHMSQHKLFQEIFGHSGVPFSLLEPTPENHARNGDLNLGTVDNVVKTESDFKVKSELNVVVKSETAHYNDINNLNRNNCVKTEPDIKIKLENASQSNELHLSNGDLIVKQETIKNEIPSPRKRQKKKINF